MSQLLDLQKLESKVSDHGIRYFSGGSCAFNSCDKKPTTP